GLELLARPQRHVRRPAERPGHPADRGEGDDDVEPEVAPLAERARQGAAQRRARDVMRGEKHERGEREHSYGVHGLPPRSAPMPPRRAKNFTAATSGYNTDSGIRRPPPSPRVIRCTGIPPAWKKERMTMKATLTLTLAAAIAGLFSVAASAQTTGSEVQRDVN